MPTKPFDYKSEFLQKVLIDGSLNKAKDPFWVGNRSGIFSLDDSEFYELMKALTLEETEEFLEKVEHDFDDTKYVSRGNKFYKPIYDRRKLFFKLWIRAIKKHLREKQKEKR